MAFMLDTQLLLAAWPADTELALPPDAHNALYVHLQSVPAVYLELRVAGRSEIVLAYGFTDDRVVVQRGVLGTEAAYFPSGACVCYIRDAENCGVEPDPCDPCRPPNPWDMVTVGDGLEIDRTDPTAPVLGLEPTGVTAGNYGGAEVNEYGQFVRIPPGWPASALPHFDPCACADGGGGGGGGDVSAGDVSYSPCGFVGGTNVQDALCQLEHWATSLSFDAGVLDVTAGDGIVVTGPTAHPVVSLEPTGITPGNYAGFQVNEFGQIVSFTPTPSDHPTHTAVAPLHVTYNPITNEWTHTVDWADENQPGVVQFVKVSDIINNTVPPSEDEWAINHRGAYELVRREISALGLSPFDISALPAATPSSLSNTDLFAIFNTTTNQHESITLGDLKDLVPQATVLLEYDPVSATTGASKGVTTVTTASTGVHTVTLSTPLTSPAINVTIRGDQPLAKVTIEVSTATTLTVRTYDLSVAGSTLQATPADHPFYLVVHEDA